MIGPIENKSALIQVMAWCRLCDKPLLELMMTQFNDVHIGNQPHELSQAS